jgi:hypothetical protein
MWSCKSRSSIEKAKSLPNQEVVHEEALGALADISDVWTHI